MYDWRSTQANRRAITYGNDVDLTTSLNRSTNCDSLITPSTSAPTHMQKDESLSRRNFICLNVLELPEKICVETRFVTQSVGQAEAEAPANATVLTTTPEPISVPMSADAPRIESLPKVIANTTESIKNTTESIKNTPDICKNTAVYVSVHTMTDSDVPRRDRAQQTEKEISNTRTVAVMCNLLEEQKTEEYGNLTELTTAPNGTFDIMADSTKSEKERFLLFVARNCLQHDDKFECLVCGEVKATIKAMNVHMVLHWGPSGLCFRCGRLFEHYSLLDKHHCDMQRKRKTKARNIMARYICPYYRCCVTAISQLELYDHINEHSAQCSYHCKSCKRNFTTACELRHHLPTQPKCRRNKNYPYPKDLIQSKYEVAYRIRVHRVYSSSKKIVFFKTFLSLRLRSRHRNHTSGSRRCQICLKLCTNSFMYDLHRKRCLKNFEYRLQKHRNTLAAT